MITDIRKCGSITNESCCKFNIELQFLVQV